MPERKYKTKKRVECAEVQGDDSYCEMSSLLVEHAKVLFGDAGLDMSKSITFDQGLELLKSMVISWNWVDDDGQPLPQVKDDPEIVHRLPVEEMQFLVDHLSVTSRSSDDGGAEESEQKN